MSPEPCRAARAPRADPDTSTAIPPRNQLDPNWSGAHVAINTRWRDTYAGDLITDRDGDPWRVQSIDLAAGRKVRLTRGGRHVDVAVDPDDTVPVLHRHPEDPKAGPRVIPCETCLGRGKVRNGAAP